MLPFFGGCQEHKHQRRRGCFGRAPPRVARWLTVVDSVDNYHMAEPEVFSGGRRDCLVRSDAGRRVRHKPDAKQGVLDLVDGEPYGAATPGHRFADSRGTTPTL